MLGKRRGSSMTDDGPKSIKVGGFSRALPQRLQVALGRDAGDIRAQLAQ